MWDWYEPEPTIPCPVCAVPLTWFQGKDGPCVRLVWRQDHAAPVEQDVDDDVRFADSRIQEFRLPQTFEFGSICTNGHVVDLVGKCSGDVWTDWELIERPWREASRPPGVA